jgi:hypothetical protein
MNDVKKQSPMCEQDVLYDRKNQKVGRRWLLRILVIIVLCVFPLIGFFRHKKPMTQTITFFKPVERFGRFSPRDDKEDRTKLKMSVIRNDFVEITEVRFLEFVEHETYDVMVTLEFIGKIIEERLYQFEIVALDDKGNCLVSANNKVKDVRTSLVEANKQAVKKLGKGARILPLFTLNFDMGISEDIFNKIAKIELRTTSILL